MSAPHQSAEAPANVHFDVACRRLNEWRGQMMENFARCEQAVTDTLVALHAAGAEAKGPKFPHLVGQRYERLVTLLSTQSRRSGHAKVALAAVAQFRDHDTLRAVLCHGVTKVAVDRAGEWVALMTMTNLKSSGISETKLTILEGEARTLLTRVVDERRRACAALGQVRRESAPAD